MKTAYPKSHTELASTSAGREFGERVVVTSHEISFVRDNGELVTLTPAEIRKLARIERAADLNHDSGQKPLAPPMH